MQQTFESALNNLRSIDFSKLYGKDLGDALLKVAKSDLPGIGREVLFKDVKDLSKGTLRTLSAIPKGAFKAGLHVKQNGFSKSASDLKKASFGFAKKAKVWPKNVKNGLYGFLDTISSDLKSQKDNKARALYFIKIICYASSSLGGTVLGYKTPDQDISLWGIGRHRNYITHSALPVIALMLLFKVIYRVLKKADEYIAQDSKDKALVGFLLANIGFVAFGASIGVSAHLMEDASLEGEKAMSGLGPLEATTLVHGTLLDDNAYLAINSLISAILGQESVKEAA